MSLKQTSQAEASAATRALKTEREKGGRERMQEDRRRSKEGQDKKGGQHREGQKWNKRSRMWRKWVAGSARDGGNSVETQQSESKRC